LFSKIIIQSTTGIKVSPYHLHLLDDIFIIKENTVIYNVDIDKSHSSGQDIPERDKHKSTLESELLYGAAVGIVH